MRRHWRAATLAGAALAAVLAVIYTAAAWTPGSPIGPSIRISDRRAIADDYTPAVAWNSADNQFLVVWADERNYATGYGDIYGLRLTATGASIGLSFQISDAGAGSGEGFPEVVWNSTARQYLVVWSDGRDFDTRREDIYGQRVSVAGSLVGGNFRITGAGGTAGDGHPDVAWNSTANEYFVVWDDDRNHTSRGSDIYGQRVAANGSLLGGNRRLTGAGAVANDYSPAVAWNGSTNQYLVAWTDYRKEATRDADVYGRLVSATGTRVGGDFRVSGLSATAYDGEPDVAWNGTANQFLVVWADARNRATVGADIYGRLLSASGARLNADFRVGGASRPWSADAAPAVAWNRTANQYLVAWEDPRNSDTRALDIYAQRLSVAGALLSSSFRVCDDLSTSLDRAPAVAWNRTANEYLVVWSDWRNTTNPGLDIYGRRIGG